MVALNIYARLCARLPQPHQLHRPSTPQAGVGIPNYTLDCEEPDFGVAGRAPVLLAEDPFDLGRGQSEHAGYQSSTSPWNGRTSTGRVVARASFRPIRARRRDRAP